MLRAVNLDANTYHGDKVKEEPWTRSDTLEQPPPLAPTDVVVMNQPYKES